MAHVEIHAEFYNAHDDEDVRGDVAIVGYHRSPEDIENGDRRFFFSKTLGKAESLADAETLVREAGITITGDWIDITVGAAARVQLPVGVL